MWVRIVNYRFRPMPSSRWGSPASNPPRPERSAPKLSAWRLPKMTKLVKQITIKQITIKLNYYRLRPTSKPM